MASKQHVKVYVRTRPTAHPTDAFQAQKDGQSISINFAKSEASGLINNQLENLSFKFDGVLENVSQDTVFNSCAQEAVDNVLAGFNSTIFCYGQTGAGKTFTMSGDARNYNHRGIIPRVVHQIFRDIDMRVDRIYSVQVSCLEIYNEALYDLLAENPAASDSLSIMDDNKSTYVRGLSKLPVRSEEEALEQYFTGDQGRSTAVHVLNANSSRSHTVFTLHIEMRKSSEADERALVSKIHLVDLAGSERTKKTNASGESLKEANFINKSLSFLEQVVNALARNDAYIPFRQTKLTAVLKDALGGNCKTIMVANVWPEPEHLEETVSTLRFAARVKTLLTDAVVNESADPTLLLKRAERQIRELKQELAMRDMLSGRGRIVYDDLSEAEQRELAALVERFLSGSASLEELPTDSLKRIRETYKAMRTAVGGMAAALAAAERARAMAGAADAGTGQASEGGDEGLVGDVDTARAKGFFIGTAPTHARPLSRVGSAAKPRAQSPLGHGSLGATKAAGIMQPVREQQAFSAPQASCEEECSEAPEPDTINMGNRNSLFMKFKAAASEGRSLNAAVKERTQQLRDLKQSIKEAAASVNESKQCIDLLSSQAASRKATTSSSSAEVLDQEQMQLQSQLKLAKARYRTDFDCLKELRSCLDSTVDGLAAAKRSLVDAFDRWSSAQGLAGGDGQIGAFFGDDDELDPGEAFERAQAARIMATNPDSGAFHAARKKLTTATAGTGGRHTGRS